VKIACLHEIEILPQGEFGAVEAIAALSVEAVAVRQVV
jgi:hypothetical protein